MEAQGFVNAGGWVDVEGIVRSLEETHCIF
jgi:hypothetical protein